MRRLLGLFTAFVIAAASLTAVGTVTAVPANAAATTQLITGANIAALADQARAVTHPSTVTAGFVVASADAVAVAQAAAAAARVNATVIVSTSTTDATQVNTIVQQKGITNLTFVGAASAFPASFRSSVSASVTTKTTVLNDSPFERSKALAPASQASFVIAKVTDVTSMSAAVAYSTATDSALLAVTGSEPANSLRTFVTPVTDPTITIFGDLNVSDQFDEDDIDKFAKVPLTDAKSVSETYDAIVQSLVDRKGRTVTKLVTALAGDLASFSLATLVAQKQGAVVIPAGAAATPTTNSPADRYLKLVQNETTAVSLVGVATTAAQLTSIAAPSSTTRTASPTWTVTNTTLGTGTYTLTYTARSGATKYVALDWDDTTELATSTTTSMTITGVPDFATLVAYNASGVELERMYFRSNEYSTSAGRETVVTGTIRNGTAEVRILGTPGIPRKIVRVYTNIFADLDEPKPEPETVAITCNNSFTDSGLTKSYEWTYQVITLTTKTGTGCGSAAGTPIAGNEVSLSAIQLPFTEDPWAGSASKSSSDRSAEQQFTADGLVMPRPGHTLSDAARANLQEQQKNQADTGARGTTTIDAVGSGYVFAYLGYIPEEVVIGPSYSGDPSKPFVLFNGSDRGYWDINSIHNKFDVRATVGSSSVSTTKHIGQTQRFHCSTTQCVLAATATAPLSQLSVSSLVGIGSTKIRYEVHTTNPLQAFAPAIDGSLELNLTTRAWTLKGTHDLMPVHQFLWGPEYSEAKISYSTHNNYSLPCLFGGPVCTAKINIHI